MPKNSKIFQARAMVYLVGAVIFILAFNNLAQFIDFASNTLQFAWLKTVPMDIYYLILGGFLVFWIIENKKVAAMFAGKLP